MIITLTYALLILLSFMPFTLLVRSYSRKINIDSLIVELKEVSERLENISPEKEKKLRILKSRYKKLKRAIDKLFFLNLAVIWLGITIALIFSRAAISIITTVLGLPPRPPSPLALPGISYDGYLNDFTIFIAVILGYQAFHNKIVGFSKLAELRR
ncbi:MAG: hypothetical protein J7J20_00610 [Desulfurococcales archaeon]|nr:hypothetical protein [Desulfurococcales archaeon]